MVMTAAEFTEKQNRRLKAALPDMQRGVEGVNTSPTAQAADKQAKMKARLLAAIDDGSWARGLRGVTLEDWKKKMIDVGINRVSSGIDAAADKVNAFATKFLPFVEGVAAEVRKMPDLTIDDSIARMSKQVRETSKFKM
jgi:hypothetical protein